MKRWAMCLTPAAAAAPRAVRPARLAPMRIATCSGGERSSTSSRKPVRWRARSSRSRQAGTTSTKRNSAARSSASCEASSIARSSRTLSGWRAVPGSAAARSRPTARISLSAGALLTPRRYRPQRAYSRHADRRRRRRAHGHRRCRRRRAPPPRARPRPARRAGRRRPRRLGLVRRGGGPRRRRGPRRAGGRLLLDGDGRVDRGEQGPGGARGAVRRRADRSGRAQVERRERPRAEPARHLGAAARGDPRRVVRRRAEHRRGRRGEHRSPRRHRVLAAVTVLIDGRAAVRPELGGVERWARELCARLPALRPERYEVAAPPAALAHRAGHAWEQGVLPFRARRAALLLGPANLAPVAFRRNVVVIHDAAVLREPSWYSTAYARWHGALLPAIARGAKRVITVSEFSARELRDLLGVEAAVVPGGVGERFTPDADAGPARAALGLDRPYVLTVASRLARKNLDALGATRRRLARRGIALLAAGGDRPQFGRSNASAGGPLWFLGPVPDEHLPGLYAGASAFVLPSLYEGFGLPCIEAMACGTPVVAADAAALPETCGEAALYADPRDPDAIADAVEQALEPQTAERLRQAGRQRAAAFTWDRTARGVDAVIDDVLRLRR